MMNAIASISMCVSMCAGLGIRLMVASEGVVEAEEGAEADAQAWNNDASSSALVCQVTWCLHT